MASGAKHRKATLIMSGAAVVVGVATMRLNIIKLGLAMPLGVILSPDLDVDIKTDSENLMDKIPGIGWLFYIYWLPYAKAIKHQRRGNVWSHTPGFATMIRVLYQMIPVFVLCYFFEWPIPWDWDLFLGLVYSDVLHLLMDIGKN